jgi:polyisoprenoid-binding protein YceI
MNYTIDQQHTTIQFTVRHLMIANVRGVFSKFAGSVDFDPANPGATKVDISIETASVATPDAQRNEHLKGADFLNAEKYPAITFKSKSTSAAGTNAYNVTGDFSLHGVTKEITLNVQDVSGETKDPWGNLRRGAAATTKISRKEFGLVWNAPIEAGVLISDDVNITIDLEVLRKP